MSYKITLSLIALVLFQVSCQSQQIKTGQLNDNINYEIKESVTSLWPENNKVHTIKKSSNGNILIAAQSGVFRYDGKSFTNLTTKLGSHQFFDVIEDRHRRLWYTSTDGVYHYDGRSIQHFTVREGLANDTVFCVFEDKSGIIWFGTNTGLSRYDGKSFQNIKVKGGRFNNIITTIMEDKTGKFWIGSRVDVSLYDGNIFTSLVSKDGKLIIDIWSIIQDKKGNIWLGGYDGLRCYDGKTFTYYTHNSFTYLQNIIEDKHGNIWTSGKISSKGNWALSRYDHNSLFNRNPAVTLIMSGKPSFLGLLEANDGSIWFGYDSGLYRYDGKTIRDFTRIDGVESEKLKK